MTQPKTIIFIGPQGSGKGTQIEKVKSALERQDAVRRIVDIQTGRRFRSLAAAGETFAENKVAATLDSGQLQSDFLTAVLWGQAMLNRLDPKSHLLIDGFPRTVAQIADLEDACTFFERGHIDIVNLDTPEEVVRARMESRAREDDTEESIEERLRWYREETIPVVEYYRNRKGTAVHDIDGTKDIEGVYADIVASLTIG
ncbi:MAG: nucleoside monophosphate kinase [Candidatus Pacebacteria bacterium]|nr:nucleoside monophosphate kinase [Candidatus Paceibacterota bacterium]